MPNDETEIIWREIPGFSSYAANSHGQIIHKRKNRYPKIIEVPSSKGTYLRVSALSDDKKSRSKEIHHLVCLAFHGKPQSDDYEVNHKDGDKHNNRPSNLEWVTRSENLTEAYITGLRKENRRIEVTDHSIGQTIEYYSMNEVGRVLGISKHAIWRIIRDHRDSFYDDRYTFKVIPGSVSNKRSSTKLIHALECKTSTMYTFDNLGDAELTTGVFRNTIYYHLSRGRVPVINGWVFFYKVDDLKVKVTPETIELSYSKAVVL